jgi:predicted MFS family arabinose efflux permease
MLDLSLFRNRSFSGANSVMLLIGLAMFGVFFYVSLFVQQVLGYSPVEAGASFLPATLLIAGLAPKVGSLVDRVGSRWLTGGGMTLRPCRPRLAPGRRLGATGTCPRARDWAGMALTMT